MNASSYVHQADDKRIAPNRLSDVFGIILMFLGLMVSGWIVIVSCSLLETDPLQNDHPSERFIPDAGIERSVQSAALSEAKAQRLDAAPEDSKRFT